MRLFIALRPPASIRTALLDLMEGVDPARWQDDEQLHLTLRFVGDVDVRQADDLAAGLATLHAPAPEVWIAGVGAFKDSLWAGAAPHDPLAALHRKVDQACVRAGLPPERRAFVPHVTLARFPRSAAGDPSLARWLVTHAGLNGETFTCAHLILYESTLGRSGASYEPVLRWPLGTTRVIAG